MERKLLKQIDETGQVAREGSGRNNSASTEENIKIVEEMILSQEDQPGIYSTLAETASELNIHRQSVCGIIDQDLDLSPPRKRRVQELTDSKI